MRSRRCAAAAAGHGVDPTALRRPRLPLARGTARAATPPHPGEDRRSQDSARLRARQTTLGCRAHDRLAPPVPPAARPLRTPRRHPRSVPRDRLQPDLPQAASPGERILKGALRAARLRARRSRWRTTGALPTIVRMQTIIAAVAAALLSGFGGAYLGAWITTRHDRTERLRALRISGQTTSFRHGQRRSSRSTPRSATGRRPGSTRQVRNPRISPRSSNRRTHS